MRSKIKTRLTEFFGIDHPVLSAPMALAAGGRLAAAVTRAGGLGIIGGGYGDADWIRQAFADAGNTGTGCGVITWALAKQPELLGMILDHTPKAMFLSFGDPAPFAAQIATAGVPLICQVQTLRDAKHAADVGAAVIVAQGAAAGGHGESRATITLVPEVADWLAKHAPDVILCAAGGITDGRGLAAALMLGADGVLVGSRFWAADEALVHPNMLRKAMAASGDGTIRSSVMDVVRGLDWPVRYTARVLKNDFTDRWHGDLSGLRAVTDIEGPRWKAAWAAGDIDLANTYVGEAAGMISHIRPAADILHDLVSEAAELLRTAGRYELE